MGEFSTAMKAVLYLPILAALLLTIATMAPAVIGCWEMTSVQGYKLYSQAFSSHRDGDLLSCFERCKHEMRCQSINYWLGSSTCELNNRTREGRFAFFKPADRWVYFENPNKVCVGTGSFLPGISCQDIRGSVGPLLLTDGEYWIDPGGYGKPFTVYCDMTTDGGGWTLIAQTTLKNNSESYNTMLRETNFRQISNYTKNNLRIDVPAISELRKLMGFSQLRYYCHKNSTGRTFHIMTTRNPTGRQAVEYFIENHKDQPNACDSFERLPDDNSVLGSNCTKWGDDGVNTEAGKWGYFEHNGTYRIYNDPVFWNGTGDSYYINMLPISLYCDEDWNGRKPFSAGDSWKLFVR